MDGAERKRAMERMQLIVDTREQDTAALRRRIRDTGLPHIRQALRYGDYSARTTLDDGTEVYLGSTAVVERKMSLDELCACFGIQRARFDREFERAAADGARIWLLVENATWENAFNGQYRSDLSATSLVGSLISWAARRKMQILFCKSETTPLLIRSILKHEMKLKLEGM